MRIKQILLSIFILSLAIISLKVIPTQKRDPSMIAQNVNEYFGPNIKVPGNPDLVRLQILIYDDPSPQGHKILKVEFNHTNISLKPADVWGFRGQGSFQIRPKKYKIKWTTQRDDFAWPRSITHEQEVVVASRDLWLQITLEGDSISIN